MCANLTNLKKRVQNVILTTRHPLIIVYAFVGIGGCTLYCCGCGDPYAGLDCPYAGCACGLYTTPGVCCFFSVKS